MNQQIISVSEFIAILNETLTFAYPEVVIEGEVSSFKVNQGKWIFFDLKDSESTLGCFMPLFALKLPLEDGMKVRITGSPKLTKWGKFSFTVRNVELAGEGELKRAMALLKAKLQSEGLFEQSRKRVLPAYPSRIGLITSGQSAAYSDFIKILQARWSPITVILADIQVQGAAAPDQIVNALEYFNSGAEQVDVLVLIRGGGSLEDLQAFSTEPVTRAVAASRTPIIVGVGHEIDVSLADFAADLRAATPTDAARLVVPDRNEVLERIKTIEQALPRSIEYELIRLQRRLMQGVAIIERYVRQPNEQLVAVTARLQDNYSRYLQSTKDTITYNQRLLRSHNPTTILDRGYAIVRQNNKILRDPTEVTEHKLMIQLAKGELIAQTANDKEISAHD
jgi:exodeoxyribonuclease VII large subunit